MTNAGVRACGMSRRPRETGCATLRAETDIRTGCEGLPLLTGFISVFSIGPKPGPTFIPYLCNVCFTIIRAMPVFLLSFSLQYYVCNSYFPSCVLHVSFAALCCYVESNSFLSTVPCKMLLTTELSVTCVFRYLCATLPGNCASFVWLSVSTFV